MPQHRFSFADNDALFVIIIWFCLCRLQHYELPGHCALPVCDGGYDIAEDSAQGHLQIQPGGRGECSHLSNTVDC